MSAPDTNRPDARWQFNPGSKDAAERIDNGNGRGYLGGMKDPDTGEPMFLVTVGCPLHSPEPR